MKRFELTRKQFRAFYEAVKRGHEKSVYQHRGHGLDHDVTVAQLAIKIAPDEHTGKKAWCAALLHSTDRLVERGDKQKEEAHMRKCLAHLPSEYFTSEEVEEILQAAYRHNELNQDDQSITQQVLMDADRLANLMPAVVIRAGQFQSEIPAFEFEYLKGNRNPSSDYYHPKSVLDDLRNNIVEYIPKLRVLQVKKLVTRYLAQLERYISWVEQSNKELGLVGISL